MIKPRTIAVVFLLAILPLTAGKCDTASPWGKVSRGRHYVESDGVLIHVGNIIRNRKTIARYTYQGGAAILGAGFAIYLANQVGKKDPCLTNPPSYIVAKFKAPQQDPYLDCGTLYPMMKAGPPYNQMAFSISCISKIVDNGKFTHPTPATDRWQWNQYRVTAVSVTGRIKKYDCVGNAF